ncbi:MAG: cytochrome D ubiquinol oxidase subunit II, partial [Limisphaerales bacterium]
FHSTRFVKEFLVMRLNRLPPASALAAMNDEFAGIISDGKIEAVEAMPDEVEDNDNLEKPRLALKFNRRDYGRLRQFIDRLNQF